MIKRLSIEREPGFGATPVYRAMVVASGRVHYIGIEHVRKKGRFEWDISIKQLEKLAQMLQKYGYFELSDSCNCRDITCWPSCIMHVELSDGTEKWIDHYYGDKSAPKTLNKIESRIEEILGIRPYICFK